MRSTFFTELGENVRAFLRAPFEQLPPQYGDTVPPELRVFEAQAEEAFEHPREMGEAPHAHDASSKPVKVGSGPRPLASE